MWSRHLDNTPGDRRSTCGARMEPIGLTFKRDGEIMIVHKCLSCDKLSPNRIAGDDNTYAITSLLETNHVGSNDCGYKLLDDNNKDEVFTILYGYNYQERI